MPQLLGNGFKLYSNVLCAYRQMESSPAQAAQSKTTAADIERRDPGPSKPFGLGKPEASPSLLQRLVSPVKTIAVRTAVYASFFAAKQPSRIRSVLKQVYSILANASYVVTKLQHIRMDRDAMLLES